MSDAKCNEFLEPHSSIILETPALRSVDVTADDFDVDAILFPDLHMFKSQTVLINVQQEGEEAKASEPDTNCLTNGSPSLFVTPLNHIVCLHLHALMQQLPKVWTHRPLRWQQLWPCLGSKTIQH